LLLVTGNIQFLTLEISQVKGHREVDREEKVKECQMQSHHGTKALLIVLDCIFEELKVGQRDQERQNVKVDNR
jgi:hypothetical protein